MIAALFVAPGGCYFGLPNVDPWDESRDARLYAGPHPVIAHPPCERWGRFWNGGPGWIRRGLPPKKLGDDEGCFASALQSVRQWGGILEHPEGSRAWGAFNLKSPPRKGGWVEADCLGGWTCCVEQGHYGHIARKLTWLYACGIELPDLKWGSSGQRLPATMVAKHGAKKASRIGTLAMLNSKDPRRASTPVPFRDLLISMVQSARLH